MYINRNQSILHKPSQLVNSVKKAQRARYRARQRRTFWFTVKAVLAATAIWAIGGALLGALFYTTWITAIIAQAGGVAG